MLIYRAPKGVKGLPIFAQGLPAVRWEGLPAFRRAGLPAVLLEGLPVVFLEDLSAVFMAEYFRLKELLRRGIQISHYS